MGELRCEPHPRPPAPSLGVVVPTLNEHECIGRLLARLSDRALEPRDRADSVVVVDGGSGDATAARAREHGARVLASAPGRGAQLALGAAELETEVLCFLHADALPAPGALASVRRAFLDPRVQATAMRQRIDAPGLVYRAIERAAGARVRWFGLALGDSGLAVRRATYLAAGGFRPLPLFEDWDLARRLSGSARPRWLGDALLTVSARRWQQDGPLRRTLGNWMLSMAYLVGVPPERLARHYAPPGHTPP